MSTVAVLDGIVKHGGRHPWITQTKDTQVVQHHGVDMSGFNQSIEVCAGIGVVSACLPYCQSAPACFVEQNEKFAAWLDRKSPAPVVHGDIASANTIKAVSELTSGCPMPLSGGISCQPFSALGDRREAADPRSQSLPALLRMVFFLRSPLMTIECTKEAYESPWVQGLLKSFTKQTGYVLHQRVLHMHNTWPAHRTRWWATLSMPCLGITNIPEMPKLDFVPSIMHLLQIHPYLPTEESSQLNLNAHELHHFHAQPQGISNSIINTAKAMPTATHSWGSQLGPCHCGCRQQGVSMSRLASKGLYGVLVPLGTMVKHGDDWFHGMRHPHPKEVAILNGLDPRYLNNVEDCTLRFLLAGVGQMASPLQGAWVLSNALFQVEKNGFPIHVMPPRHVIANMCRDLFAARIEVWPQFSHNRSTVLFEREVSRIDQPITNLHPDEVDDYARERLIAHFNASHEANKTMHNQAERTEEAQTMTQGTCHVGGFVHMPDQAPLQSLRTKAPVVPDVTPCEHAHTPQDDETPCLSAPAMTMNAGIPNDPFFMTPFESGVLQASDQPSSVNCPGTPGPTVPLTPPRMCSENSPMPENMYSPADAKAVPTCTDLWKHASAQCASVSRQFVHDHANTAGINVNNHAGQKPAEHAMSYQCPQGHGNHAQGMFPLTGEVDPGQARRVHAMIFQPQSDATTVTSAIQSETKCPPQAGRVAPGMPATPGYHNAVPQMPPQPIESVGPLKNGHMHKPTDVTDTLSRQEEDRKQTGHHGLRLGHDSTRAEEIRSSNMHAPTLTVCQNQSKFFPGMPATPGQHNAGFAVPVPRVKVNTVAQEAQCPLPHAGPCAPGMSTTPGYHNVDPLQRAGFQDGVSTGPEVEHPNIADPLMLQDPWATAMKNPSRSMPCNFAPPEQDKPTYNIHGGLNLFAGKKRPIDQSNDNPSKKQLTSPQDASGRRQCHVQASDPPLPSDNQHNEVEEFQVWVGHNSEPLHQVTVTRGTTVGQLAIAENSFLQLPEPVRALTAMGSHLPVYKELNANQIVLLEDGRHAHMPIYPCHPGLTRDELLWKQQGWVGVDEMSFYLKMIGQPNFTNTTRPLVMHGDDSDSSKFEEWLRQGIDLKGTSPEKVTVHTACLHDRHWFPVTASFEEDGIHLTTTQNDLPNIREWAVEALGPMFHFHYVMPQESFPADCGFQAFAWIMAQTLHEQRACPMDVDDAIKWRSMFAQHLHGRQDPMPANEVDFGGMLDPVVSELSNLLQAHGVAPDRAPGLTNHLVKSFGMSAIKQTLGSARPWADLKNRASTHQPPIKLVLTEELQQQIASRLQSGKPLGNKKNKQDKKSSQSKWTPPPAAQVQVPDGIFQQQDGVALKQITMHQLQSNHRGVVVAIIQEAVPFFRAQKPLCTEGAGLLVLDFQDPALPESHQLIRFPASCPGTQEPMILTAALVQLGQQQVTRTLPSDPTMIDQVDTAVIRAVLYRDQTTMQWQALAQKPVKALLELEHFQSLGKGDLLDVWDRQMLNKHFQKVKAEEAEMFSVVLRVQAASVVHLMESNGKEGLFFEPRTQNGRGPCPIHRVVWMPKQSFHDVMFAKQATAHTTFITRSGDRFGLRVHVDHAPEVHQQHRPEVAYLDGTHTKAFRVAPLPFGSTKQSLQKVFGTWGWSARPSHTQGLTPDKGGLVWVAHATEQPPFFIYTMQHGDVLITEVHPNKPAPKPNEGVPVASMRTLKHLSATATAVASPQLDSLQPDPLQINDPWAGASRSSSHGTITPSQVASIETNVERGIRAAMKEHLPTKAEDAAMEPEVDARVVQLESQVNALTDNLNQLAGTVSTFQKQQQSHNTQVVQQVQALKAQTDQQENTMHNLLERSKCTE